MYDLTLIQSNGGTYIDSREVAQLIGKRHDHLLRDIGKYRKTMEKHTAPKIGVSEFFLENTYIDTTGRELPCYLLSKKGCELVANKLTGEKGILFTIAYVTKFNDMELAVLDKLKSDVALLSALPVPRLGEYNACARIIAKGLRDRGASAEEILKFLKGVYEPLGIVVAEDGELDNAPQMFTAKQIAKRLGIYSVNGNPHYHAVSCILNENLFIDESHKTIEASDYGNHIGVCVRYDEYAVQSVKDWLAEYSYPNEIYGFERTYRILYRD